MTDILRVSSLAGWHDCSRRSAARSFRKRLESDGYEFIRTENSVGGCIGTGVHSGMAYALKQKIAGKDIKLDDMIDAGVESFRDEADKGVDYDSTTDTPNTADKQIESMIKVYYHYILPKIEPVEVEVRMDAVIDETMTLSGQPDVLEFSAVRDLKTGRSGEKYHAQLGGYILLAKANKKPVEIDTAVIDWLPRARLSKPQPEPVELEYSAELCVNEAKAVIRDVQRQYGGYNETGNPSSFPNNTSSMICTPKFCPAYGTDWCKVSKTLK
jgi:hypothetical protein